MSGLAIEAKPEYQVLAAGDFASQGSKAADNGCFKQWHCGDQSQTHGCGDECILNRSGAGFVFEKFVHGVSSSKWAEVRRCPGGLSGHPDELAAGDLAGERCELADDGSLDQRHCSDEREAHGSGNEGVFDGGCARFVFQELRHGNLQFVCLGLGVPGVPGTFIANY